ncbi:MAG: sensor histidine kinase [Saccharospirillum sp.]
MLSRLMPGPAQRLAPIPTMLLGMAASVLLVLLAAIYVSSIDWMGLRIGFDESAQRPVVSKVYRSDLSGQVSEGDIVRSIMSKSGDSEVYLYGFIPGVEPPSFATFREHNAYLMREASIARLLQEGEVRLSFQNGRYADIQLQASRPFFSIPLEFWLFNLFGLLAWNIGLAVLAVRPRVIAARLLALSGFGFYMATLFNSIYLSREFALPGDVFLSLSRLNHLGLSIMLYSLIALMAYFPKPITRVSPFWVIAPTGILVQLNEWQQWYQWPLHAYYLPIFILYLAGVGVAIYQWRLSRSKPLDRAALKWMLLTIFIIMGLGLAVYFVPIALTGREVFPQWSMVGIASLLYIGFAFGIVRYRLFDVQRWWLKIWGWFLGGVAIIAFDLVMISLLNMQPMIALSVAVISVGWIYFPIRQWFLDRLARAAGTDDRRLVDQVEKMAQTTPSRDSNSQWQQVLVEQFTPAGVDFDEVSCDAVQLQREGAELAVPMVTGEGTLRLTFPDFGRRLFSLSDVEYVQSLLQISRRILAVHAVELQAVKAERQRIVRDLHDDVGGHLLTLLRQAPSESFEVQARKALQALRQAMQAMDADTQQRLIDCLDDWRLESEQRLRDQSIELLWRQDLLDVDVTVTVRQSINAHRILSESITNALQHANPGRIAVDVRATETLLTVLVENDGLTAVEEEKDVLRGRGLNNMLTRASELGGQFEFKVIGGRAKAIALIPLLPIPD